MYRCCSSFVLYGRLARIPKGPTAIFTSFCGFAQSLQVSTGLVSRIGRYRIRQSHSAYHADYTVCHKAEDSSLGATQGWNTATDCFVTLDCFLRLVRVQQQLYCNWSALCSTEVIVTTQTYSVPVSQNSNASALETAGCPDCVANHSSVEQPYTALTNTRWDSRRVGTVQAAGVNSKDHTVKS